MSTVNRSSFVVTIIRCYIFITIVILTQLGPANASASALEQFAAGNARELFGSQSTSNQIATYHDSFGNDSVNIFLVTKIPSLYPDSYMQSVEDGQQMIAEGESLLVNGLQEEGRLLIRQGRELVNQEDKYGTMFIAGSLESYTVVAFHHGLPTFVTFQESARKIAEEFYPGDFPSFIGILYVSPLQYYFEFQMNGRNILVNPFDSEVAFKEDIELPAGINNYSPAQVIESQPVTKSLSGISSELYGAAAAPGTYPDSGMINDVPDYNQPQNLPNSCAPAAGANLLLYWDANGYSDFLPVSESPESVTDLIEDLSTYMSWDPAIGVHYEDVQPALQTYALNKNYTTFDVRSYMAIGSMDIIKEEVMNGHPIIYGSQINPWGTGHFVVVVGYQDNFLVVHDNWPSTPKEYFVNWNSIGHADDMVTLFMPDNYYAGTLPGTTLQAGSNNVSSSGGGGGGCFIDTVDSNSVDILKNLIQFVAKSLFHQIFN